MAETREKEKREQHPAVFTDGDYIPRSEAPNMPRIYLHPESGERAPKAQRGLPATLGVCLCAMCLFFGLWLGSRALREEEPPTLSRGETAAALTRPAATAPARSPRPAGPGAEADAPGLGISVQTVSAAAAEYYRLYCDGCALQGAQIYALGEDSAAQRAGLRAGDILLAVDGEAVRSAEELRSAEGRYRPGDGAVCRVYREGELLELPVVFEEKRPPAEDGGETDDLEW